MKIKDLIFDTTCEEGLERAEKGQSKFYLGIDPTADSMHIGHLSSLVFAHRLVKKGNKAIVVVGGTTAQIGDPSGKKSERTLMDMSTIESNAKKLTDQIKNIIKTDFEIENNNKWLSKMTLPTFLRDYGKLFNVSSMIKKDIVASRLDAGISYTEFTYQILQAIDFRYLAENNNCEFQIGGQDQWGNITAGLDLIRKTQTTDKAFGITLPLITNSDGTKFGKTESGAIWLDKQKTSTYQLYQFLKNTPDVKVINLIKSLTLCTEEELKKVESELENNPKGRFAQNFLAESVVRYVHGESDLSRAKEITDLLFKGDISSITSEELILCLGDVPNSKIDKKGNIDIQELLVISNAAKSKREARELIFNRSIMLNGKIVKNENMEVNKEMALDNSIHVIKRGKRKFFITKY